MKLLKLIMNKLISSKNTINTYTEPSFTSEHIEEKDLLFSLIPSLYLFRGTNNYWVVILEALMP